MIDSKQYVRLLNNSGLIEAIKNYKKVCSRCENNAEKDREFYKHCIDKYCTVKELLTEIKREMNGRCLLEEQEE